ncbi:TetR/AcrR family transcriptional regulator [Streptomyces sp. WMMC897]|uniref:TetR/AcrR family transcriptional regulator n=1 Tax=Streptomyces sp. WMMC897 TaxID=3014782 RepID=UPI0022B637A6|nr:TetR/AcrR family transcriptional regulator [Streptomyces sp. WMMC897]MCZ7414517.1 WHG domain-containing protein [Streptomyces sp. WMMC897]
MPRAGLTPDAVVEHAVRLIDDSGPAALTLGAVAQRAGVATPSLYKHVGGLPQLRLLISVRVLDELTERTAAAVLGRSGDEALTAFLRAYRAYVRGHPNRYTALRQQPEPALDAAAGRLLDVLLAVLRGRGLHGSEAVHAARCLRSAAHGFAVLEAAGGFGLPEDLDTSYAVLVGTLTAGLPRLDGTPGSSGDAPAGDATV